MDTSGTPRGWYSTLALMLVITLMAVISSWLPVSAEGEDLFFGGPGTGNGQFSRLVHGMDTDTAGNIYVLDGGTVDASGNITAGMFRVQKFNAAGVYQSQFSVYDVNLGVNNTPTRIAVSDAGEVFVLITNANQVRRYVNGMLTTTYTVSTAKTPLNQNDGGNGPDASNAGGIYVRTLSGTPYLFVVLNNGTTVRKFTISNGTYTDITLSRGASLVTDLAVQNNGNLYILGTDAVSGGGCLIMAFGPTGTWSKNYGSGVFDRTATGFATGDVARHFVEVDSQGNLYSMACPHEANLIKYAISEGKIYYRQAQFGFGDPYSVHGSDVFMTVDRNDRLYCLPTNWYVSVPSHHDSPVGVRLVSNYFSAGSRRLGSLGLGVVYEGNLPYNISNNLNPISLNFVVTPATRIVHTLNVNYQVYDMYKTSVASGNFTLNLTDGVGASQAISFTPPKYGWYDATFTMYDTTQTPANYLMRTSTYYGVTPTYTGCMPSAAAETLSAGESVGGWTDIPRHAFAGLPYMRIDSGASTTDIQNIITQAAQYGVQVVMMFEDANECAQAHVQAIATQFGSQIDYYEVINEPDLFMSYNTYATYLQNVSTWVKAIDPTGKIVAPSTCGVNLGFIQGLYNLGMKNYFDVLSVHDYEGHESIDPSHWTWKFGQLRDIMTANGDSAKQIWQTEHGVTGVRGGTFLGSAQAIRETLQADMLDSLGIPINHNFYYYMNEGGWRDLLYMWSRTGPHPTPLATRTRYAMTRGTLPTSKLDFGTTGNKLFFGLRYTAGGSNMVTLRNIGSEPNLSLTLNVTSGSTITVIDAFGNETTQAVSGGQVTLSVPMMPIYLRLAAGQDISVPAINYGTNMASSATFSYSSTYSGAFSILTNGINEVHPVTNPNTTLWWGDLPTTPQTLEMTFPTSRSIDKVLVFGSRADNAFCTLLDFDLDYWNGTSWVNIQQVRSNCPASDEMDMFDHYAQQWMLDQNFHNLTFNAVTTNKLRFVVYRTTYGFDPDQICVDATMKAWGGSNPAKLTLHEIEVYGAADTTPPAAPTGVSATAGNQQVVLDWADNTEGDLAGYNVYRSTTSGGSYTKVNTATVTSSTYTNTGLTNGTTYYYVVRSLDTSNNESGNSSQVSAVPSASTVVATPTASPAAGTYTSAQSVTLSCTTTGATIRYTTNGSTPTSTTGTVYSGAISISSTTTLKAIAYKSGMTDSAVLTATYTINTGGGPDGYTWCASENGSYTFSETVDVAYGANGQFYYQYGVTGTINFNNATFGDPIPGTVKAGYYRATSPVATPTFSPAAGTYLGEQTVTISTTTSGASIRYTTDGTTPTSTTGTVYSAPVTLSSSCTLKAIAYKNGMTDSNVASGSYTIIPVAGWFDAAESVTTDGANHVTQWANSAPGGDTSVVFNGATGVAPTLVSSAVNGLPALQFTGTGGLTSVNAPDLGVGFPGGTDCTLVMVKHSPDTNPAGTIFDTYGMQFTHARWYAHQFQGWDHDWFSNSNANGGTTAVLTITLSGGSPGTIKVYLNGTLVQDGWPQGATVGRPGGDATEIALGQNFVPGFGALENQGSAGNLNNCYIPEMLMFSSALSDTQRQMVEGYLREKYDSSFNPDTTPPAVPTGVSATAGNQQVVLDWADNSESDLAGYNVYRSTTSGGSYTKVNSTTVTTSTYTDTGLTNSTTYYYVVRSVDTSDNESGNSTQVSATPSAPSPVATPTFSPAAGTYIGEQTVTISTTTSGASIRYTTDGTTPTSTTGTVYSAPVTLDSSCTLKAIAYKSGMTDSNVASGGYTIIPVAGWFDAAESVTTDGNDYVTEWVNSAPGGDTSVVFNGTSGSSATLVSSAINGLPALQFIGVGGLTSVNAPDLGVGFPGGTDCTLVMVKHSPDTNPAGTIFDTYGMQFTHARWYAHQFQGWDHNWFSNSNLNGGTTAVLTITLSGGSPGTIKVYLNGTLVQDGWPEGATVGRPGGDATEIALGQNHVPGFGALESQGSAGNLDNCYIPEVMMFSSALSDTQRQTVEGYLRDKYDF